MNASPRILYIDMVPNNPSQMLKLAGIRRYAALRGWEVVCVSRAELRETDIRSFLARHRPIGVVVEGSGHKVDFPPRIFRPVPVSYIEYPVSLTIGRAPNVIIDDDAVADAAFRELSQGKPVGYAAIGFRNPYLWSRLRIRAFKRRCAREGQRFIVFPGKRNEPRDRYELRLAEWIAALPSRTAVFTVGDTVAVAATRAARVALRHIPKDLTLCSVCDIPEICERATPPVTSIPLDFERMGFVAARALAASLEQRADGGLAIGPLLVTRRKSTSGCGRHEPWVLKAVEIIRAEACEGLTIGELLAHLKNAKGQPVSRRNFDRRFREAMGHSANEEILSVRLESACALLAQTDASVTTIHDFCGFGCYSNVDALFRSRFGMSMSKWRERNAR